MMHAQSPHRVPSAPRAPVQHEGWFVAFGPDDVRLLTLEQLDDAYRLDVINDDTLVRSPSMDAWAPLGVVAGAEETAPDPFAVVGNKPAVFDNRALFAAPAPASLLPNSVAPLAFDVVPSLYEPPRRGRASRWALPLMLCVLCGGAVVAHRTGGVAKLAGSVGMQARYAELSQRVLGAPGIDTPVGTQTLLDSLNQSYGLDEVKALALRYSQPPALPPSATATTPASVAVPESASPAAEPPAQQIAAAGSEQPLAAPPVDINSLPPADVQDQEAKSPPVALAQTHAAPSKAQRATPSRGGLKSSRKTKSRLDRAQEYDPLYNLP